MFILLFLWSDISIGKFLYPLAMSHAVPAGRQEVKHSTLSVNALRKRYDI
jgi:hypothetical protein